MLTIFKDWKKSTSYKECMSYQGKRDKKQGGHPVELLENHAPTKGLALDSFTVNSFQDLKKKTSGIKIPPVQKDRRPILS